MKAKSLILVLSLALCLTAVGVSLANDIVQLPRWVLGGGASDSTAGGTTLRATLGQPVVGLVTGSGGHVTLGQGTWRGRESKYNIYLPLVIHDQT